jgi:molecular chaperone GrpE
MNEQHVPEDTLQPTNQEQNTPLDQCRQELTQWKERCMLVSADFDNYKRRMQKEQASWARSSKMMLVRSLLPVIDTVELALLDCAKRTPTAETASLISGIQMMGSAFHKFLESAHVTEITALTSFDPLLHEAIAQVKADTHPSGDIVEVLQKGYLFEDQVLRPAKVSVAQ